MECQSIRPLLSAHIDQALQPHDQDRVQQHLLTCVDCQAQVDALRALRTELGHPAMRNTPSAAFGRSLQESLRLTRPDEAAPSALRPGTRRGPWWQWFLSGAATASMATTLLLFVNHPADSDFTLDEITSNHYRSLQVEHLADVASSDRHTVKPWFTGKLDYAPSVHDFTQDGYTLVGGRLDYLQHRNVSALVYRYHQHVINVYVWPVAQDTSSTPHDFTRQGFHLLSWQHDGMQNWAVSDTGFPELHKLQQLIDSADGPNR